MKLRTFVIMAAAAVCLAGSAFAANTLTVNAASALNNTGFGMQVALDGPSTNNVYVQSDHPNAESHYLARFFICPSSLALASSSKPSASRCARPISVSPTIPPPRASSPKTSPTS